MLVQAPQIDPIYGALLLKIDFKLPTLIVPLLAKMHYICDNI